jgi:septal ring factor EnvC (AmiA/AmiB activator)
MPARGWRGGAFAALAASVLLAGGAWAQRDERPAKAKAAARAEGVGAERKAESEKELRELRGRIERLQGELAAAEKTSGEAADQLKASGRAVSEAHRALFALAQERAKIEQDLKDLAARERDARAAAARQEELAARLLRIQRRQGAPDRVRLALEGRDAATVARHMEYYNYIQRARAALIAELRARSEEIAGLARDAASRREELARNESASLAQARTLERERAERAAVVARLAGEIARGKREIGRLRRDEERLARLVQEISRALARSPEPARPKGRTVDEVADASVASRAFATLKGHLKLPVRGELASRFGTAREEAGTTWKGLFIRAVTGETVHAVADGRVVYADWLRGFGNLLIVDHGKGYMSLYAYNEGLLRQVGDKVRAGDPVAQVGASGESADSGLYFELRRDGKPFDPMKWVAQ